MSRTIVSVIAMSLVLGACSQSTPPAPVVPPESTERTPTIIPAQPNAVLGVSKQSTKPDQSGAPSARIINMMTRNWAFSPASISVKKGEKVTVRITGESGTHGFAVPDLGINKTIRPGEVVSVELPTDKAGSYRFFCSVPCGPGHVDMEGSIVIEE